MPRAPRTKTPSFKPPRGLSPAEATRAERRLRKLMDDPLKIAGDAEFEDFVAKQFDTAFGTEPVARDATGRTVPPRLRSDKLEPFRPKVSPDDLKLAGPVKSGERNDGREDDRVLFGPEPKGARRHAPNRPADVLKLQKALSNTGDFVFDTDTEVSGRTSKRLDDAVRRFQKRAGLKVDGLVNPDGPTNTRLVTALFEPSNEQIANNAIALSNSPEASDRSAASTKSAPEQNTSTSRQIEATSKPTRQATGAFAEAEKSSNTVTDEDNENAFVAGLARALADRRHPQNEPDEPVRLVLAAETEDAIPETPDEIVARVNRATRWATIQAALHGRPVRVREVARSVQTIADNRDDVPFSVGRTLALRAIAADAALEEQRNALGLLGVFDDALRDAVERGDQDPEAFAEQEVVRFLGFLSGERQWVAAVPKDLLLPVSDDDGGDNRQSRPRGMHNPRTREAVREGNEQHRRLKTRSRHKENQQDSRGRTWQIERNITTESKRVIRPDVVTPRNRIIELKPDTPSGRRAGRAKCRRYTELTGWPCRVVYYRPRRSERPDDGNDGRERTRTSNGLQPDREQGNRQTRQNSNNEPGRDRQDRRGTTNRETGNSNNTEARAENRRRQPGAGSRSGGRGGGGGGSRILRRYLDPFPWDDMPH